jgi:hypothetical protein
MISWGKDHKLTPHEQLTVSSNSHTQLHTMYWNKLNLGYSITLIWR